MTHNNTKKTLCQLLILALGLWLIVSLSQDLLGLLKKGERIERAEEKLAELKNRNEELKKKLEEVQSDEFVEKIARDRLNMAKENEVIVILPNYEVKSQKEKSESEEDLPNWQRWWRLFF